MKEAPTVGEWVKVPMGGRCWGLSWNARVMAVSEDGRFVKVEGGVFRKGGRWYSTAALRPPQPES